MTRARRLVAAENWDGALAAIEPLATETSASAFKVLAQLDHARVLAGGGRRADALEARLAAAESATSAAVAEAHREHRRDLVPLHQQQKITIYKRTR